MNKHYELTPVTRYVRDREGKKIILHRIRALEDMPQHGVRKYQVGGWVQSEQNLTDSAWIHIGAMAFGDARITDDAALEDQAMAYGHAHFSGSSRGRGNSKSFGYCQVADLSLIHI